MIYERIYIMKTKKKRGYKMVGYFYKIYKDKELKECGRTLDKNYILNLIKYKSKSKRYNIEIIKGDLIIENESFKFINCQTIYNNLEKRGNGLC